MNKIGLVFKDWLNSNGITQQTVADDIGASLQYVNGICNGRTTIGKKIAKKLADIYGISESFLLTGEGEIQPTKKNETTPANDQSSLVDKYIADLRDRISEQKDTIADLRATITELRRQLQQARNPDGYTYRYGVSEGKKEKL